MKVIVVNKDNSLSMIKKNNSLKVGENEVLVKHVACGINLSDISIAAASKTRILGTGAVGIIEEVGKNINKVTLDVGDRVVYQNITGSFCERRILQGAQVIRIPSEEISNSTAAGLFSKTMFAYYLLYCVCNAGYSKTVLVHTATTNLAQIICQLADHRKAKVIGSIEKDSEAEIALSNKCTYAINYHDENFLQHVKNITSNKGVDIIYDSLGLTTHKLSLQVLAKLGVYILYDNVLEKDSLININKLLRERFLFITDINKYHLAYDHLTSTVHALRVFELLKKKVITYTIKQYPFDALVIQEACRDMQNKCLMQQAVVVL